MAKNTKSTRTMALREKAMELDEKRWRQEDDARTLARAEEIKKDAARLRGAKAAARRIVQEQNKSVEALKKVAENKVK